MRRPRDDSTEWLGRLYDEHASALYRYAVMILADREAAADALQQVFTRLADNRPRPDIAEHYLRRAIRNECYSMLRRRKHSPVGVSDGFLETKAASDEAPEERLAIQEALRGLPTEQREVVHLKIFEGMTFQEIADVTSESINTVASRYRYAIAKLKELLHE